MLKRKTRAKKRKPKTCSQCGRTGHTRQTCKTELNPGIEIDTSAINKDRELGHKLLKESKQKVEREEIDGLVPATGLWIVNHSRKKIAGKICYVKRTGEVVWKSALGATTATPQEVFKKEEYSYLENLEPEMLSWNIVGRS
jgi:hypothetical protein